MALAVDIHRLLKGGAVEWERIDFRKGFQALPVLRSICAFANDIGNAGGGYIILGVEQDAHRLPVFPVRGLSPGEITIIRQELFRICKYIRPPYYPIIDVADIKHKQILVLWVPAGATRPYQVPRGLNSRLHNLVDFCFYVRSKTASTRKATAQEELELISMANQIPFDSQIQYLANVEDLNITLIQEYLSQIKSGLLEQSKEMPFIDLCRVMNIVGDCGDGVKPKNVGLLMFNNHPEKFMIGAYIKVVELDAIGRVREKIFTGPLFHQVDAVLTYIQGMVITKITEPFPKSGWKEEYFNFPYSAVKEGIINAVYHRDYREYSPIEIRVSPQGMEIISYPGPLPPLNNQKLKLRDVSLRRYRNPTLGHFLKQRRLVQGLATGLDKICFSMANNKNPISVFETDRKLRFFKISLPIHPKCAPKETNAEASQRPVGAINNIVLRLSPACPKVIDVKCAALILLAAQEEISLADLMFKLDKTNKTRFRKNFIKPLMALEWLAYTIPDKPQSEKQKYVITQRGRDMIENES